MNGLDQRLTAAELNAWVDDRLAPAEAARIERDLAGDLEALQALADLRSDRDALRAALGPVAEEPVPARLKPGRIAARRRADRWRRAGMALAACLILGAGLGLGAHLAGSGTGPEVTQARRWMAVAQDAITAHRTFGPEIRYPVEVTGDDPEQMAGLMSRGLGRRLPPPDLRGQGLTLLGGRILPSALGRAAMFMYQNPEGDRVIVYVKAGETGVTSIRRQAAPDLEALYWIDDGCAYVVTGSLPHDRMQKLAETVFNHFEERPAHG